MSGSEKNNNTEVKWFPKHITDAKKMAIAVDVGRPYFYSHPCIRFKQDSLRVLRMSRR